MQGPLIELTLATRQHWKPSPRNQDRNQDTFATWLLLVRARLSSGPPLRVNLCMQMRVAKLENHS
jgi:hypothetical protein